MDKIYKLRKYVSGSVYDLQNFAKRQINCVSPKLFNDPIDTYFYYSNSGCFADSKKILTQDIMDRIRISCFVDVKEIEIKKERKLNASEILMWTHYANSHKGLCFEYEIPSIYFSYFDKGKYYRKKKYLSPVSYLENLATDFETIFSKMEDYTYSSEILFSNNFEDLLKTCYYTKDKAFEYEKEIRLLLYSDDITSNYIPFEFKYFTKVIFGKRCEEDMKYLISCINKQCYKGKLELLEINDHFQEVAYEI